jgi:membrane protein
MAALRTRLRYLWLFVVEVIERLNDHNGAHAAAAVSYYILLSVAPLLVLAVAIASWAVTPEQAQKLVIDLLSPYFPGAQTGGDGSMSRLIPEILKGRGTATGIGLLMLAWAGTAAVVGLETSINFAWNTKPRRSFLAKRFLGAVMMVVFGIILAGSLAGSIAVNAIRNLDLEIAGMTPSQWPFVWKFGRFMAPLLIAIVGFTAIYRIIPTKRVPWRVALIGGIVAGVLWELAKQVFGYYAVHFSIYSTLYGSLTSITVFTIWVNYSALVAILGAEVGATLESRMHARRPSQDSSPVS